MLTKKGEIHSNAKIIVDDIINYMIDLYSKKSPEGARKDILIMIKVMIETNDSLYESYSEEVKGTEELPSDADKN